jgi:FkbM family methyltransferase
MDLQRSISRRISRWSGQTTHKDVRFPLRHPAVSPVVERALVRGSYEVAEANAVREIIRPTDRVLELGAGLGFIGAYLRRTCRVAHVCSYEANPDLIAYIRQVHELNEIDGVEIRHGVVLANPNGHTTVPFHARRDMWWGSLSDQDVGGGPITCTVDVPVAAWSAVLSEVAPTALVMDIEGGELDLITAGAFLTIERIVVELHPAVYGLAGLARISAALDQLGFAHTSGSDGLVLALERRWPRRPG